VYVHAHKRTAPLLLIHCSGVVVCCLVRSHSEYGVLLAYTTSNYCPILSAGELEVASICRFYTCVSINGVSANDLRLNSSLTCSLPALATLSRVGCTVPLAL